MRPYIIAAIAVLFLGSFGTADARVTKQQQCDAAKQKATARLARCLLVAASKNTKRPDPDRLDKAFARCDARLKARYRSVERKVRPRSHADAEDQCSWYGDADNVISFFAAAGDALIAIDAELQRILVLAQEVTDSNVRLDCPGWILGVHRRKVFGAKAGDDLATVLTHGAIVRVGI